MKLGKLWMLLLACALLGVLSGCDDSDMVTLFIFIGCSLVLTIIWAISYRMGLHEKLREAQAIYEDALNKLKMNKSAASRVEALEAGRAYVQMARKLAGQQGIAIFDEVALQNDLQAYANLDSSQITTGTPSSAPSPASGGLKQCPDCAEDVKAAARKCRYCGYHFETITIDLTRD
jgi:hypothetical protein